MTDKGYQKRQAAMKKRIEGLGTDNPVVKMAAKSNEPKRDAYKEFSIVDELVRAARNKYSEGGDFQTCVSYLAEALGKLAKSKNTKGLDTDENKGENNSDEENY